MQDDDNGVIYVVRSNHFEVKQNIHYDFCYIIISTVSDRAWKIVREKWRATSLRAPINPLRTKFRLTRLHS